MPILQKGHDLFVAPTANISPEQDRLRNAAVIERIARLEHLMGMTPKYGAVGAPGGADLVAQRLRDASGRFLIDLGNTLATVSDTSGTIRAQMGNLPANGISPAQFGFRANNAAGAPIFDSLGLINVMSLLASGFLSVTQNIAAAGSNVVLTATGISFTLARASSVLFFYGGSVSAACTGDAGNDSIDLWVDGVAKSSGANGPALTLLYPCTTTGATTSTAVYSFGLTSGAHTANLRASCPGTNGLAVVQANLAAYLLGT
jgi:hypothetical protein